MPTAALSNVSCQATSVARSTCSGLGSARICGRERQRAAAARIDSRAVTSLTRPSNRYSGAQTAARLKKCVAPKARMEAANIQNRPRNARSRRLRASRASAARMLQQANPISRSDTAWSRMTEPSPSMPTVTASSSGDTPNPSPGRSNIGDSPLGLSYRGSISLLKPSEKLQSSRSRELGGPSHPGACRGPDASCELNGLIPNLIAASSSPHGGSRSGGLFSASERNGYRNRADEMDRPEQHHLETAQLQGLLGRSW